THERNPGVAPWATSRATASRHLQRCRCPIPVANSVTHVAGLKCYLCPWTEPTSDFRLQTYTAAACDVARSAALPSARFTHTGATARRYSADAKMSPSTSSPRSSDTRLAALA